jgi:hypothetical protein
MVAWRVAKSLLTLKGQWQAAYPGAANPGFIGDAAHATRDSDHNPWVDDPASSVNVVTAGDFYHQPEKGADAYALADALKKAKDPRVKYVISRRKIWSLARDGEGWRPYNGANPHTGHTHVSVSSTKSRYDDTRPWKITTSPPPEDDDMPTPKEIEDATYRGTLRAMREYGAALFKDEQGSVDTILDETREHRAAELAVLGEIRDGQGERA